MVLEIHERLKDFNEIYRSQSAEDQVPLFTQTQQLFPKCNIKIILGAKESIVATKVKFWIISPNAAFEIISRLNRTFDNQLHFS